MALNGDIALCTVADVEAELGLAVPLAGAALAYVENTINRLSEAVEVYLGRGPLRYRTAIVDHPEGRGWPKIRMRTTPIRVLTSIVVEQVVVDATTYHLMDEGRTGIVFFEQRWPFTGYGSPGINALDPYVDTEGQDGIDVTYDAGWWLPAQGAKPVLVPPIPDLPGDITRGVVLAVVMAYQSRGVDRTVSSERLLSHSQTFDRAAGARLGLPGFTEEGAAILKRRRRPAQA